MPDSKDIILALFGASVGLAGLLLVFIGFVYSRGESYKTVRGDRFKFIAKIGVIPFLIALTCAWLCLEWLTGTKWAYSYAVYSFKIVMFATAAYGTVTMLHYL